MRTGAPAPAAAAPPHRAAARAWVFAAAGCVAVALLAAGPEAVRLPLQGFCVLAGLGGITYGALRIARPEHRRPWMFVLASGWLFFAGVLSRVLVPEANASPPTTAALLPDALVIPGYLCALYGFAELLRRRRAMDDDPAQVDAMLVGVASAFMCWTYLIGPSIGQTALTPLRIANAFFPVLDVVVVLLVAQLFLSGVRVPALWLLSLGTVALLAGDVLFTIRDGTLAAVPGHAVDACYAASFLLYASAMLHPSMRTLTEPQRIVVKDLGKLRTALIALMVIGPVVVTTFEPIASPADGTVRSALCSLLVLAVFFRVVRSNNSRARAERATRRRATHDALTDLPNRELLAETVAAWGDRAEAADLEISLLFIDLDRFKMINDHWGHQVGDELLCSVADRLAGQVRGDDLVCRIGGDEFVIALASPSHSRIADALAERVLTALARPFELSVGRVVISASIGVAKSRGGAQALELIRDADTAMYKAKGEGRNAVAQFDTTLREQVRDRMDVEQALRGALERGEIFANYQPIMDLATGELDGFEALMRWEHPELGLVSPMKFIPVAEDTGLIVDAGAWLLRESARQLAAWRAERGPQARPLHVSVNVSVRQLRDRALVTVVRDVLAETGLPPEALWLEITESGVMEDIETALATLGALRELGVTMAIDDFGTGYSSLSYLNLLPVGIVKLDRSFVSEVGEHGANESIVRAVLLMTRAMNLRVVAEGVETGLQRDWLREQGCDLGQGWLFGKPQRAAEHRELIRRGAVVAS